MEINIGSGSVSVIGSGILPLERLTGNVLFSLSGLELPGHMIGRGTVTTGGSSQPVG